MANLEQSMDSVPDFSYVLSNNDDPVSKAVVDNILGKIPTKKPRVNIRCETCAIDFTSQVTYDTHIIGAKHQKKLKALSILKTLQEEGKVGETDTPTNLRCNTCSITLNSSSQLQMHLTGTKHLNKSRKRTLTDSDDTPGGSQEEMDNGEPPIKSGKLSCAVCNVVLNSESQYTQHITSKKHQDKFHGRTPQKSFKNNKKKKLNPPPQGSNSNNNSDSGMPLLSESFLPPNTVLGANYPDYNYTDGEDNY